MSVQEKKKKVGRGPQKEIQGGTTKEMKLQGKNGPRNGLGA